ncbi:unnamed protein product [Calicophoron daubneyi]|uniref:Uncharacterized protein n=1 Tax=Calicophoron daubneyi TaxID=300641 RepID=A0AAV2T163_CALDB
MSWGGGYESSYPSGGFGGQGGYPNQPPYGGPGQYGPGGPGQFGPGGPGQFGPGGPGQFGPGGPGQFGPGGQGQFGPCGPGQYGPNAGGVNWIPSNPNCEPPPDAVKAKDGMYVIRARVEGDIIPGKWVVGNGMAYIPYGGKEVEVAQFEVLCIPGGCYQWMKAEEGNIPSGAIQGGVTSSGEALFIARGDVHDEKCVGKVHPSHQCAYFPWGGKEHSERRYKVLCFQ